MFTLAAIGFVLLLLLLHPQLQPLFATCVPFCDNKITPFKSLISFAVLTPFPLLLQLQLPFSCSLLFICDTPKLLLLLHPHPFPIFVIIPSHI